MKIDAPKNEMIWKLRQLWKDTFGDTDAFLDAFFSNAFSPSRARCITVGDQPVAALYWFDCRCRDARIAYIYAVATAKEYRGQGLCRALMEDTHRHLHALGYEGAVLVPSNERLFEMYRKMGYETCGYIRELSCDAAAGDVQVDVVNKEEYARLRRSYLPVWGVVQEGENLDFLETQYAMMKGDGCVFAAYRENEKLICKELLGDASAVSQIVSAMGCKTGVFRVPGEVGDGPFAMYHSLGSAPAPTYFGLAFD